MKAPASSASTSAPTATASNCSAWAAPCYVFFKDLDDWFGSLWHGRRLGCTLGVLSLLGFLLCRGLARVHDDEAANPEPEYPAKKENT